ncbi:hypothetical protein CLTEP_27000 [Clostridium tepidiprofundi DSM 19306]|uniref:Uncharacterized protein n=1 Tax=Clostridium tepidiprofundi DSM 19306 TaxID=1121338 RepID=A0A151AQ32_9CLOT|nr:hypothetical protein CLTEP_27000 [Clostridium tepidiprofundi DSM 19306]
MLGTSLVIPVIIVFVIVNAFTFTNNKVSHIIENVSLDEVIENSITKSDNDLIFVRHLTPYKS